MGLFSFLQAPVPELQLYGKLPIAKDYLRIGMGDGVGMLWRTWLDQNFSTDIERGEPRQFSWPVGFLLGAEKGDPHIGCVWNSTDAGGHRKFPFSLSVCRKRKEVQASLTGGLPAVFSTWARLKEFRARALACADGQGLMGELRGKKLPHQGTVPPSRRNVGLQAWCDALWPSGGMAELRRTCEDLRELGSAHGELDLRLALAPGLDWSQQVQAWFWLLEYAGCFDPANPPNFFAQYTGGVDADRQENAQAPAALWLTHRTLSATDAARLCGDESDITAMNFGLVSPAVPDGGEGSDLYPVECSLSQALAVELDG